MKKVMVVDDSPSVRQQVGLALTQAGYDVLEACDGQDGLQKATTPGVALLICDINMPKMNGFELLEKVKADPKLCCLPVVMLTSEGQPSLMDRAKKAGAKGWIIKPFKAALLVAAVKKIVPI
jgi:two-component system chemotaxis response regulator CheY